MFPGNHKSLHSDFVVLAMGIGGPDFLGVLPAEGRLSQLSTMDDELRHNAFLLGAAETV
jgi:hypothetical protein